MSSISFDKLDLTNFKGKDISFYGCENLKHFDTLKLEGGNPELEIDFEEVDIDSNKLDLTNFKGKITN